MFVISVTINATNFATGFIINNYLHVNVTGKCVPIILYENKKRRINRGYNHIIPGDG